MDVLEIMQSALNRLERGEWYEASSDLEDARAAVAELIGSAQYAFEFADGVEGMSRNNIDNIGWEVAQRLGPALANVRGK